MWSCCGVGTQGGGEGIRKLAGVTDNALGFVHKSKGIRLYA